MVPAKRGEAMSKELIRCYQCRHFKPVAIIGSGKHHGWCQDAKPKIRVDAVDFCEHAVKKEAEAR